MGNVLSPFSDFEIQGGIPQGTDPETYGTVLPAVSGGTATFGWVASSGLVNNEIISVSSDSLVFAEPDKQIYIGHGMGWLYDNPDDTDFASIVVGGESISYEGAVDDEARRKIKTIGPQKYLHSLLYEDGGSGAFNAGFVAWDTGAEITNSDTTFQFSRSRCEMLTNPTNALQWKQDRVRATAYLTGDSANSAYITDGTGAGPWSRVVGYNGSLGAVSYSTSTPKWDATFSSFAWIWNPNTADAADGHTYTREMKEGEVGFQKKTPIFNVTNEMDDNITTVSANRPRWIQRQDYIGNNNDSARDIAIDITDIYWKLNGDAWFLADNPDLDLCVEEPIALVPLSFEPDSKTVNLNLWLGSMSSYTGKYIVRVDADLTILNTVAL